MNETIKRPVRINCVLAKTQIIHLPNTSQKCYRLNQIARSENQNTSRFEKGICKLTVVVALMWIGYSLRFVIIMAANTETAPTCSLVEKYATAFRINLFCCHPRGSRRQQVYQKQWYILPDDTVSHQENVIIPFNFLMIRTARMRN